MDARSASPGDAPTAAAVLALLALPFVGGGQQVLHEAASVAQRRVFCGGHAAEANRVAEKSPKARSRSWRS